MFDQTTRQPTSRRCPPRHGFTLIEVMLVVVLLGIMAAVTVPQFFGIISGTIEQITLLNEVEMEKQVDRYYQDHGDYPSPTRFPEQMTMASNKAGDTAEPGTEGYPFGPYIDRVPENPRTGGNTVGDGSPGTSDWQFDPFTGSFRSNHVDQDVIGATRTNMKTIIEAVKAYAAANGGTPPRSLDDLRGGYIKEDRFTDVVTSPRTRETFNYTAPSEPISEVSNPDQFSVVQEIAGGRIDPSGLRGYLSGRVSFADLE